MKAKTTTLALILILSTLASVLQLTSCNQNNPNIENSSFVDGTNNNPPDADPGTGWTADHPHGEKILYGKQDSSDESILRFGDMLIGETNYSNTLGYYTIDEPGNARLLCFDPLCLHLLSQDSCPAITNDMLKLVNNEYIQYPQGMYIDLYESSESPVVYFYYLRSDHYAINLEETIDRDPVYCIERYDMSQGKRYTVLDNVENTIQQACNYGDYVYFVLDMSEGLVQKQKLCRVHKSGTEPEEFDMTELPETIRIVEATEDAIFYTVDEKYLYRCNLDLTESEKVLDLGNLKGQNDSIGVLQGCYSGYLYYIADAVKVLSETKVNLYRIPVNDLAKEPEMVVEGMAGSSDCYMFAEKTLYYVPCVAEFDNTQGGETAVNICDGKMMALDLKTGKSNTIVENSGMTIFPLYAWDDMVVFAGWAYNSTGEKYSNGNNNLLLAYTSGEPFKIWCRKREPGKLNEEYLESIREVARAAREEYEAKQNGN